MHQSTDTHRTAKDLSPEELDEYRQQLDQHFQNRKVDEALLQRAWQTAHRVAAMLYEDFGATQVAVFGSLAQGMWFSKSSDIDVVVWGLPGDTYLEALWETRNFSPEFKIDLVNFDSAKGRFRERIQSQAVPVQRGETDCSRLISKCQTPPTEREETHNEINNQELIERIVDERSKIGRTVEEIRIRLRKMESASAEDIEDLKAVIALRLLLFYTGLEKIFGLVAREIDMDEPKGAEWHKNLLQQMVEVRPSRPPVISEDTFAALTAVLRFRHRLRNIYVFELEPERTAENGKQVCALFNTLSTELDAFISYLDRTDAILTAARSVR